MQTRLTDERRFIVEAPLILLMRLLLVFKILRL